MAFIDENGKITIDENAAERDVKNLLESKAHLLESLSVMRRIEAEATEFVGDTGVVLGSTAQQLQAQIQEMINEIDQTINRIRQVVSLYQAIDTSLKETVQGFYQ